jgi:exonuclease III
MPRSPTSLRFATLNANGLRESRKRNDLLRWLRDGRWDLVALQDTRFNEQEDDLDQWCTFNGMRAFWTSHTALLFCTH